MKIIKLTSQNIKNLKAIEINPDGNVLITGANEAGKSSVLDSVFCTLTGTRLADPIRHGQSRAEVVVDLGDITVKRIWTEKGERLEVLTKDGDVKKSPQAFLNEIIGKLSFDPMEFQNMPPKDQRNLLKSLVGLDFSDIDAEYQKTYLERTEVNVKIKGIIAQLQSSHAPHPQTPDEEISYKEKLVELQQLRDKRKEFLKVVENSQIWQADIGICEQDIPKMEQQILDIQYNIKLKKEHMRKRQEAIDNAIVPPEVTENEIIACEASLQDIEKRNVDIRAAMRYRKLVKESNSVKEEADAFTQKLNRLEQDKATRISNIEMPVPGLSMSDDAVIFEGIPFSQLSTGRRIRVSTAIAMKLNPNVRVIFVRDGSLLDSKGKQEIFDIAKENDYQVWLEEVDDSGQVGFFISDGELISIDGKPVEVKNGVNAGVKKEGETL